MKIFLKSLGIISILSCLLSSNAIAQALTDDVEFNWGQEVAAPKNSILKDIFAIEDGFFYALRTEKDDPVLEKYDFKCNQLKSVDIDLKSTSGRKKSILKLWHSTDKIYMFSDYEEPSKNEHNLTVQTVNKNSLNPNSDVKQIASMDNSKGFKWDSGIYQFAQSPDSTCLLIYFETPKLRGEFQEIGLQVYDQKMNLKWEGLVEIPYKEELFRPDDFKIGNDGKVYILGSLYKDKLKDRVNGMPNYAPRILCFSEGGTLEFNYDLKMGELFLVDKTLTLNDEGDIICAGFYSEEGKMAINGVFSVVIDGKSLEIKNSSRKAFEMDMVVGGITKKEEAQNSKSKSADPQLIKYKLRDLISKKDGGYTLIGEQYYTYTSEGSTGNGGTYTITHYAYNHIVVIDFAKNGDVNWATKVFKFQHTKSDGGYYSSFATCQVDDHLYLIYNDNIENLGLVEAGRTKSFNGGRKGTIVTMADIGPDGEIVRKTIIENDRDEVITVPKVCVQTGPREMIFFGDRKKTQKFAILKFK